MKPPRHRRRGVWQPLVALLGIGLIGLLVFGVAAQRQDLTLEQALSDGKRPLAPERERRLPDLDGSGTRSLADFEGKIVVVNFWASWCTPCEAEAPALQAVHEDLARTGQGTVIGVTYQDTTEDSLKFVRRLGITFPSVRDVGVELAEAFGTRGLPETFVLDPRGRVVMLSRGQVDERRLRGGVRRALGR